MRYLLAFDGLLDDLQDEARAHARMARYGQWVGDWWTPAPSQTYAEVRIEREGFIIIDQETNDA